MRVRYTQEPAEGSESDRAHLWGLRLTGENEIEIYIKYIYKYIRENEGEILGSHLWDSAFVSEDKKKEILITLK